LPRAKARTVQNSGQAAKKRGVARYSWSGDMLKKSATCGGGDEWEYQDQSTWSKLVTHTEYMATGCCALMQVPQHCSNCVTVAEVV
jgi:hypothetical protein